MSIAIRTPKRHCEVGWFAALCGDDYEFLGVPDEALRSTYEHCGDIVRRADENGFQNILLPSSWIAGQDPISFAAAMATQTKQINQLVALRMGEVWPPMLARAIATLDHISKGRLCLNIISSDLPGLKESSEARYNRSREVIQILQGLWQTDGPFEWRGEFYNFTLPTTQPAKPYQNGGPLLYFGGISPPAQELCAQFCDVFLMWPETEERLAQTMQEMSDKAAAHGRKIDFGLRVHVIVRESRRIIGQYVLNEDDLMKSHRFDDAIATGCWYLDLHPNKTTIGSANDFKPEKVQPAPYDIPYRCLVPQKLENLLVAGRSGIKQTQSLHGYGNSCLYFKRLSAFG